MSADTLLASLRAAGLNAKTWPGWKTRGNKWRGGKPTGVMHHHTSLPVPFPVKKLAGPVRIKANINTKPDGTVWLIAYRACNYSSGPGSGVVLNEVKAGIVPTQNARTRGLHDTRGGNRWFWNFENDHRGDGSAMPAVQSEVIVTASQVVLAHFEIEPVISHAEWTRRKSDPYWNGDRRVIDQIRADIKETDIELSPEAQRFYEKAWKAIGSPEAKDHESPALEPESGQDILKALAQDLRDRKR